MTDENAAATEVARCKETLFAAYANQAGEYRDLATIAAELLAQSTARECGHVPLRMPIIAREGGLGGAVLPRKPSRDLVDAFIKELNTWGAAGSVSAVTNAYLQMVRDFGDPADHLQITVCSPPEKDGELGWAAVAVWDNARHAFRTLDRMYGHPAPAEAMEAADAEQAKQAAARTGTVTA